MHSFLTTWTRLSAICGNSLNTLQTWRRKTTSFDEAEMNTGTMRFKLREVGTQNWYGVWVVTTELLHWKLNYLRWRPNHMQSPQLKMNLKKHSRRRVQGEGVIYKIASPNVPTQISGWNVDSKVWKKDMTRVSLPFSNVKCSLNTSYLRYVFHDACLA